jgi:hypothetical protein
VRYFWGTVIRPLLDLMRPAAIVEIGAANGRHTRLLAAHCREHGGVLHVVDPVPAFDIPSLVGAGGVFVHEGRSLDVLPRLPAADIVLIDGDHNWYTIFHELKLLQQAARDAGRPTPVIVLHDVGWPCGRRDFYYAPETIPDDFRHPWVRLGIAEGQPAPHAKDKSAALLASATVEGGPRNGVLTAIEDFVDAAGEPVSVTVLRRENGLGALVPRSRCDLHPGLEATVAQVMGGRASTPSAAEEQLIPRIIHRVWLGPEPIPSLFERYAESWRAHHPDWELRLWRDETLPALSCQAEFNAAANWNLGHGEAIPTDVLALETWRIRYDIVRLEILRQFGGVIVDMDVEAIRPLDPLLGGVSAFAGRATRARRIGNQVLGAIPRHPFFEFAVRELRSSIAQARTGGQSAGNGFLTRLLEERPEGVTVFPRDTFYSTPTVEPLRRPDDFPAIFAVHHHLESYRTGPEAAITRLERRLHEAQREIEALEADQRRLRELNEKANVECVKEHTKRQRAQTRLDRAMLKIERLEQKSAARRVEAAPPPAVPLELQLEPRNAHGLAPAALDPAEGEGVSAGAPVR